MSVKKIAAVFLCAGIGVFSVFPQAGGDLPGTASAAFVQGAEAFRQGEWISAVFLLRKAVSYHENMNADTFYMLIAAEMYAGEYKSALQDCEEYLRLFPESGYISYVSYHKGRALFFLGEYEKSVFLLSDFCHQYPDHEMYASALFWIAESFYAGFNYNEALGLYMRVVEEFPSDAKAPAAQYRIETIAQRSREEKLLYLLKETGEEYLSAREEYERQLKLSGAEDSMDISRKFVELQRRNEELEAQVAELTRKNEDLSVRLADETGGGLSAAGGFGGASDSSSVPSVIPSVVPSADGSDAELIREMKRKAAQMQILLDEKTAEENVK